MSKQKNTGSVNFSELRKNAGLTLAQLSELTGYGVATINGLEKRGEGSQRMKDKVTSVLLSSSEEGAASEVRHWRDRAMIAEQKLTVLKAGMIELTKKI